MIVQASILCLKMCVDVNSKEIVLVGGSEDRQGAEQHAMHATLCWFIV